MKTKINIDPKKPVIAVLKDGLRMRLTCMYIVGDKIIEYDAVLGSSKSRAVYHIFPYEIESFQGA